MNCHSDWLNARIVTAFRWDADTCITWLSPIASDDYAEYYDEAFLDRLGVSAPTVRLYDFWPPGGPRWDGLARSRDDKLILVEAKAHIEESVDYRSHADPSSMPSILNALDGAKVAFHARDDAPWPSPLYQYANRLAHLHYLAGLNQLDAYLIFIYFANAPDVPRRCSVEEWRGAARAFKKCLGLAQDHPYTNRVADLILDVPQMLVGTPCSRP